MKENITPIYVLGSPRSGTTLFGNYLGSSEKILDLGEYFGIAFNHYKLPDMYKTVPSKVKDSYLKSLQRHSFEFADEITKEAGLLYYCDSTPWNILVSETIVKEKPEALFILLNRDYKGVIQSLERSYNDGFLWAGSNLEERAQLYSDCYSNVVYLPPSRTIIIDYDKLCSNPIQTLERFRNQLKEYGIDSNMMDEKIFTLSNATKVEHKRKPLAVLEKSGEVTYNSISSYYEKKWSKVEDSKVLPIIKNTKIVLEKKISELER